MNRSALSLLRQIASRYDVSLKEALTLCGNRFGDHRDEYPLVMLIEAEYIGITINHTPPTGAEKMREYSFAVMLHQLRVGQDSQGRIPPAVVFIDASADHVFIKAKGALYLDEIRKKRWDRFFSFLIGVLVAVTGLTVKAWIESRQQSAAATVPHIQAKP